MKIVWISNAIPFSINSNTNSISGGWLQEQFTSLIDSKIEVNLLPFFPNNKFIKQLNIKFPYIMFNPIKNNFYSILRAKSDFKKKTY